MLDYKSEQYTLNDDRSKSKFVKDILAFANTMRPNGEPAYILIGVKETERHTGTIQGVDTVLDGNVYQQLIDSKANKHIPLDVGTVGVDGKQIQVITIPCYNNERPFYVERQFGVVKANEVYFRSGSITEVATPEEIYQWGALSVAEEKPLIEIDVFSTTGILNDGNVYSFYLESDIDPSYGTDAYGMGRFGYSHWEVFKWYQEEVAKLEFHVSLSNTTSVQADNVKVKVRILNRECGAKVVAAPDWGAHPSVHMYCMKKAMKEEMELPRSLCPGENCQSFKSFYVTVDKSCDVRLSITILGRNLTPIEKEFKFHVVRHVVNVEIHNLQEIERNVADAKSNAELTAHLLGCVKTAKDHPGQEPDWKTAMNLYRRKMWDKMKKRLGISK